MTDKDIVERLRDGECCQAMGGVGCHPPRCAECPRTVIDLIERLQTQRDKLVELAYQYLSDLRYPPSGDSKERRIERVKTVLEAIEKVRTI